METLLKPRVEPDHLNERALQYLKLPDAERIQKIFAPRWFGYPRADEIHERLNDLYYYPKVDRMPGVLVVGDSNAGKSEAVKYFVRQHAAADGIDGTNLPILFVQATPRADLKDFFSASLRTMHAVFPPKNNWWQLRDQLIHLLDGLKTRMLVIDEVHNMLMGSSKDQRDFLATIKYISNELRIPIIAIGTSDALNAFQTVEEVGNRFEPMPVPRWTECVAYRELLASFELTTPLWKPSVLDTNDALAAKLLVMSEGLIGELAEVLRRAGVKAVRTGRECIDKDLLEGLGWVLPSLRKAEAAKRLKG